MINKFLPFIIFVSLLTFSCGKTKEKENVQVKREVVKPPVQIKDTLPPPTVNPQPAVKPKPENKYFLIAGSFSNEKNAQTFQKELIQQGYDSEIIVRKTGKNKDFYKVSFKAFYDREEAFNELSMERKQPNNQDVWLLIKK
jgi:cell division protein FtsN